MCQHCDRDSEALVATDEPIETETEIDTVECEDCGDEIERGESGIMAGRTVCQTCADDYVTCYNCECELPIDDCETDADGDYFCSSCYSERYTSCVYCSDELSVNDCERNHDGDACCSDCYHSYCTQCEECGCVISQDDSCYCERTGCDYCEDCLPADPRDEVEVPYISDPGYLTRRAFAVELEVIDNQRAKSDMDDDGWEVHSDSSIGDSGTEYCSGPIGGVRAIGKIERAAVALREAETTISQSCGFHLHLDMTSESAETVASLVRLAHQIEEWAMSVVHGSRRRNRFCAALPESAATCDDKSDLERVAYGRHGVSQSIKQEKYNAARYCWVNVHSWFYRGTIEIRLHSGTADANKVLRWAEFWLHAVEFAKSRSSEEIEAITDGFQLAQAMGLRQSTIDYFVDRQAKFARQQPSDGSESDD